MNENIARCSHAPTIDDETAAKEASRNQKAQRVVQKIKVRLEEALTTRNIVNVIFILTICTLCLQQCYSQVSEYLKFSTRLQVTHTFPGSTLWLMPGITICTNNRLRVDKLIELVPDLAGKLEQFTKNDEIEFVSKTRRLELMRSMKSIVDEHANVSSIIDEYPIPKLMDLSRAAIIRDINCNPAWGKEYNCENFRVIESYQSGSCYTLFYLGAILEAVSNGKAYDFNSSLIGGDVKLDSFGDQEVAEILINFEPSQHADFYRDVGGRLVIHSTGHVGSVRDMSHQILPGRSYDVVVRRFLSKRLPPPYKSMCYDYKRKNSPEFTEKEGSLPSVELDKTTCVRNCVTKHTTKQCNCWPVEVPYYLGDKLINDTSTHRTCEWISEENQMEGGKNQSTYLYVDCYKRFHSICKNTCRAGCRTEDYRVSLMQNTWPTRESFLHASSASTRRELLRLRSCCARISVKYLEFMENRLIMYPSMTLAQLVSNIGGIVSGLVGVSAVTIYRYLTRRVFHCKVVSDYTPSSAVED